MAFENLTPADVERMPSEVYRENFKSAEFRDKVNSFEESSAQRGAAPQLEAAPPRSVRDRQEGIPRAAVAPEVLGSFDPAFDEEPPAVVPVVPVAAIEPPESPVAPVAPVAPIAPAPVAAAAVVPPASEELTWEYQPTLDGIPVGGKQVFKYKTLEELRDKLTAAHTSATLELRRRRSEGLVSDTKVAEGGTPMPDMEWFETVSPDEEAALRQALVDPEKAASAKARLAESKRNAMLNQQQEEILNLKVESAARAFRMSHPEYLNVEANNSALVRYIISKKLDPTNRQNFELAYNTFRENGALFGRPEKTEVQQPAPPALVVEAPIVREEKTVPKPQAPVVTPARISEVPAPQTKRTTAPIATGLSNVDSTNEVIEPIAIPQGALIRHTVPAKTDSKGKIVAPARTYTDEQALDIMPADDYRKFIEEDRRLRRQGKAGTGFEKNVEIIEARRNLRYR
jgi:hypothetical protein